MDEALIGLALLLLFGGGSEKQPDEPEEPDDDEPKRDTPFCAPTVYGPMVWDPNLKRCVPYGGPTDPDAPDPVEPPVEPSNIDDFIRPDYTKDGTVFQVQQGWIFGGVGSKRILFQAIADKAYRVAIEHGKGHDEALAYAQSIAGNQQNRNAYFRAILCEPFNDRLYGTYGYGEVAIPGPNGRSIRLLPQHADNIARMRAGESPIRSIRLRTPQDAGKGNAFAFPGAPSGHLEAIYLPLINGAYMWATGGIAIVNDSFPKAIADLGWLNRSGQLPASIEWGC
jgi:hypothetical protein